MANAILSGGKKLFTSLKNGVDFGLKFFAIVSGLLVVHLLYEQPELRTNADVLRLIDLDTAAGQEGALCPETGEPGAATGGEQIDPVISVVCRYNSQVRNGEGVTSEVLSDTSDGRVVLTQLIPAIGSDELIARSSLDPGVTGIIRSKSLVLSGVPRAVDSTAPSAGTPRLVRWVLQTPDGETTGLPSPDQWADDQRLRGCDELFALLNARYGPVACLAPVGSLVALSGSSGLPQFALELYQGTGAPQLDSEALLQALGRIEAAFMFEARVTVRNEGKGIANDTDIAVPPGYQSLKPEDVVSDQACRNRDSTGTFSFPLESAGSCDAVFHTTPLPAASSGLPLAFGATASNERPWVPSVMLGFAIAALAGTVLYVVFELSGGP